jgi:hypothetical protein
VQGLSELLHSPSAAESWQGELWLFELLQLSMDTRKGAMSEQQQAPVRDLFHGLLASDNPRVRRIYSSVTERLLLSLKAQVHTTTCDTHTTPTRHTTRTTRPTTRHDQRHDTTRAIRSDFVS